MYRFSHEQIHEFIRRVDLKELIIFETSKRLKKANEFMKDNNFDGFFEEIEKSLWDHLGTRWGPFGDHLKPFGDN